jgi:hypothetical protein
VKASIEWLFRLTGIVRAGEAHQKFGDKFDGLVVASVPLKSLLRWVLGLRPAYVFVNGLVTTEASGPITSAHYRAGARAIEQAGFAIDPKHSWERIPGKKNAMSAGILYRNITLSVPALTALFLFIAARPYRSMDAVLLPAYFMGFNLLEYLVHRFLMHRPGTFLFDHVGVHHGLFNASHPYITAPEDNFRAVVPLYAMFAISVGAILPAVPIGAIFGLHAAVFFLGCAFSYYSANELLHYAWHAGMLWRVARHHLRHHEVEGCNYNFTFPVCDFLLRTKR